MHIVIMGCGRVGSRLAHILEDQDHSVAIIDQNPEAFRKLGSGFKGTKVTGIGFDRDVLTEAGIERAGAFAAVSSGDNSNVIAARVARESFGVQRVVARIYDPRRAEVYQRLGIPTVATVAWTADQMLRRLVPEGAESLWRDPTGAVVLAEVAYSDGMARAAGLRSGARRAHPDHLHHPAWRGAHPHCDSWCCRRATWSTSYRRRRAPHRRDRARAQQRARKGRPLMRVAIAGAGAVGRSIAKELLDNGHEILLIDKDPSSIKVHSVPKAEWLLADACEISALDDAAARALQRGHRGHRGR